MSAGTSRMTADAGVLFASDNGAPIHPEVLRAIAEANVGHAIAYGDDRWTERALAQLREHFGPSSQPFIVLTGTGANVLALTACTRSHHAVVCSDCAHANVDECGAPEHFTGCKLLALPAEHGKITPEQITQVLHHLGFEHAAQPRVVSITEATEVGTIYTPDELRALCEFSHRHGLLVHMDGARLCNAAAALDLPLRALTTDVGIDVLSFGGTKNGLAMGEAVVFLNPTLAADFKYQRKQGMQLASKMRFVAAQIEALLHNDLWLRNARQANAMARLLADRLAAVPNVVITHPVQTNAVFARIPHAAIAPLQAQSFFYVWDEGNDEVRWMCSYDVSAAAVERFAATVAARVAHSGSNAVLGE
jgi:threonine aldolase